MGAGYHPYLQLRVIGLHMFHLQPKENSKLINILLQHLSFLFQTTMGDKKT